DTSLDHPSIGGNAARADVVAARRWRREPRDRAVEHAAEVALAVALGGAARPCAAVFVDDEVLDAGPARAAAIARREVGLARRDQRNERVGIRIVGDAAVDLVELRKPAQAGSLDERATAIGLALV